ncbi:GAMYB transcription factor [Parasponia andersonii]|uniref:GAMYB transcription factor n=1 Tax=Parasponia andersonii TaxID=3476 RepID=A0A2P5AVY9_PARAD|nr:GAMYB transcription factor [Parasponia andersonii]
MQRGQEEGGMSSTDDMSTSGGGGELTEQAGQQLPVEEASPISSRPPAASVNLDHEFMSLSSAGAGGSGGGGGNRWPRQETLALLKVRSDMDAAFRDATLKGPLWEDVSRKLAVLGYHRSGKKCKEKFENVHKYYKRTKEGRAGRQDGKTYKFFTELEALHGTAANQPQPHQLPPPPPHPHVSAVSIGISNPMPISSLRASPNVHSATTSHLPPPYSTTATPAPAPAPAPAPPSFSSNSSSSSPGSEEDDDDNDLEGGEPSNAAGSSRKRKRDWSSSSTMMEFFENLMKQVMHKQEAMQQRFLEVIEKREQDRMIKEEAWKRQEMARLTREHQLMAQERAISASRDAAIVSFLQKITGQTIQLPDPPPPPPPLNKNNNYIHNVVNVHAAPPPHPAVSPPAPAPSVAAAPVIAQQHDNQLVVQSADWYHPPVSTGQQQQQQLAAEQQEHTHTFTGGASSSSSRWPKAEVLELIKLRSGLETKYQEAGPKGPLWEEISAEMQRMGYKRSAKRCKEKWENINKYFKKVKESNKKRPEDAKTCPYFNELDALYRKKILGSGASYNQMNRAEQQQQEHNISATVEPPRESRSDMRPITALTAEQVKPPAANIGAENKIDGAETSNFGEAAKEPEDIVMELMEVDDQDRCGGTQAGLVVPQQQQTLLVNDYDRIEELADSHDDDEEDEDEEEDTDDEDQLQVERKMANYKLQLQRQTSSTGPSKNGAGNETTPSSFLAMVQ